MGQRATVVLCIAALMCAATLCCGGLGPDKVHAVTATLPALPAIDVTDPERFLNDLMLSPLWKVEKTQDGDFVARARAIIPGSSFEESGRQFLFELMASADKTLPEDYQMHNRYLDGRETFSAFRIMVVFEAPDLARATLGVSGQPVTLGIYDAFDGEIGPNSASDLAIKLSSQHAVYVLLHEQGRDPTRSTTFAKVLPTMQALAALAASPAQYRVEDRYAAFFRLFFETPLRDPTLQRFPDLQDRDTFYGYFRAQPDTSYSGVNIKVSHPVYCGGECTRKRSRLEKAEYLGTPYHADDVLFFLIEDNAVYVLGDYNARFGTFTGDESFDGTLEILNAQGDVLLRTTEQFKGWQR